MANQLSVLEKLVQALDWFLEGGATSESDDPSDLECDALEEGGYVREAVVAVQQFYPSKKLPSPAARGPWRALLRTCRHEVDLQRRQDDAHDHADALRQWALAEIAGLGSTVAKAESGSPLRVDSSRFAVSWQGGETFTIGNRNEFRLLAHLANSPNQFVAMAELAEAVFGDDLGSVPPVKCRLVKMLRDHGLKDLATAIRTQRGHYGLFFS